MTDESRQKAAACCTDCDRALAVWLLPSGEMNPIGSGKGCPCGGTSFRLLG